MTRRDTELGAGISRPLVVLPALTSGTTVASLYYAQPLPHTIARAFSVSDGSGRGAPARPRGTPGRVPGTERLPYATLLRPILELVKGEPVLRQRMLLGAAAFGCFSVLWSKQSAVNSLHGQARSRLTTADMVAYFLAGVVLSAVTSTL